MDPKFQRIRRLPKIGEPPFSFSVLSLSQEADVLLFSLAGLQLKFSAVKQAAGGLTIPAEGIGGSPLWWGHAALRHRI
jgi:hypothetical protein